jgi:hypothetical protein
MGIGVSIQCVWLYRVRRSCIKQTQSALSTHDCGLLRG